MGDERSDSQVLRDIGTELRSQGVDANVIGQILAVEASIMEQANRTEADIRGCAQDAMSAQNSVRNFRETILNWSMTSYVPTLIANPDFSRMRAMQDWTAGVQNISFGLRAQDNSEWFEHNDIEQYRTQARAEEQGLTARSDTYQMQTRLMGGARMLALSTPRTLSALQRNGVISGESLTSNRLNANVSIQLEGTVDEFLGYMHEMILNRMGQARPERWARTSPQAGSHDTQTPMAYGLATTVGGQLMTSENGWAQGVNNPDGFQSPNRYIPNNSSQEVIRDTISEDVRGNYSFNALPRGSNVSRAGGGGFHNSVFASSHPTRDAVARSEGGHAVYYVHDLPGFGLGPGGVPSAYNRVLGGGEVGGDYAIVYRTNPYANWTEFEGGTSGFLPDADGNVLTLGSIGEFTGIVNPNSIGIGRQYTTFRGNTQESNQEWNTWWGTTDSGGLATWTDELQEAKNQYRVWNPYTGTITTQARYLSDNGYGYLTREGGEILRAFVLHLIMMDGAVMGHLVPGGVQGDYDIAGAMYQTSGERGVEGGLTRDELYALASKLAIPTSADLGETGNYDFLNGNRGGSTPFGQLIGSHDSTDWYEANRIAHDTARTTTSRDGATSQTLDPLNGFNAVGDANRSFDDLTVTDVNLLWDEIVAYFDYYADTLEEANETGTGTASRAAGPFNNPQSDGKIAFWTPEDFAQINSADAGTSLTVLVTKAKRSMADAARMYLGCMILLQKVWPQLTTTGPNGIESVNYNLRGSRLETVADGATAPSNYGYYYNQPNLQIRVPDNLTPESYRDVMTAPVYGGGANVTWSEVEFEHSPNNTSGYTYNPERPKGVMWHMWGSDAYIGTNTIRSDDGSLSWHEDYNSESEWVASGETSPALANIRSTFTDGNKQVVENMMSALDLWLRSLKCIIDAAANFDDFVEAQTDTLSDAAEEHRPGSHWYDRLVPDFINSDFGKYGDAANFNALRAEANRLGSMTLGGFLESNVERLIFKEQCFLLSYIVQACEYRNYRLGVSPKKLPYITGAAYDENGKQACIQVKGDGYGFMNRLTQPGTSFDDWNLEGSEFAQAGMVPWRGGDIGGLSHQFIDTFSDSQTGPANLLNEMPHSELANLQPMIRLFKIYSNEATGEPAQQEYHFESNFASMGSRDSGRTAQALLSDRSSRGSGVGIKDFSFTYDGSNPFAVKKSIKGSLTVFANSFEELLQSRNGENINYQFIELALKTASSSDTVDIRECRAGNASRFRTAEQNANLEKLNFRLKAVVGWARPETLTRNYGSNSDSVLRAIYDSYVTLELTPTVHDFAFDEQGRVTFKIKYLAYIEDIYDQNMFNIFANAPSTTGERRITTKSIERELHMDFFTKKCSTTELNNIRENYAKTVDQEKRLAIGHLLAGMMTSGKMYYVNLPYDDIKSFIRLGPFYNRTSQNAAGDDGNFGTGDDFFRSISGDGGIHQQLISNITEATTTATNRAFNEAADAEAGGPSGTQIKNNWRASLFAGADPENQTLSYFYAGDLIDYILENIQSELSRLPNEVDSIGLPESAGAELRDSFVCKKKTRVHTIRRLQKTLKKLRVVLGPLEVVNQGDISEVYTASLGDVPISTKYFIEWLTEKMLSKEESVYPLTRFMNDFYNEIVRAFLNNDSCFGWNISQRVRVQQASITGYQQIDARRPNIDSLSQAALADRRRVANLTLSNRPRSGRPVIALNPGGDLSPISNLSPTDSYQYLVYFCGRVNPSNLMVGNRRYDEKVGIPHFLLGAPRGLVKTIELQKTETPGLAEVRFEQDGYDGLRQLRVVYDAYVTLYASVKIYPGTYIYIDPGGYSPGSFERAGGNIGDSPYNLTQYGIGGYYMVIKSENNFAAGIAETKITAKWVHQIESEAARGAETLHPTSTDASAVRKCSTSLANDSDPFDPNDWSDN